jgi:hypothetical protein
MEVMGAAGFFFIYCGYGSRPAKASHANIFAFDIYRRALERAVACAILLLSLRHRHKMKKPSEMEISAQGKGAW